MLSAGSLCKTVTGEQAFLPPRKNIFTLHCVSPPWFHFRFLLIQPTESNCPVSVWHWKDCSFCAGHAQSSGTRRQTPPGEWKPASLACLPWEELYHLWRRGGLMRALIVCNPLDCVSGREHTSMPGSSLVMVHLEDNSTNGLSDSVCQVV